MSDLPKVECPKPGIYHDVPFETYLSWPAISNSRISTAFASLLHFKEGGPIEATPAMRLGSFLHCGVLEPLAIPERYAVMPAFELDPENKTDKGAPSTSKTTQWYKTRVDTFARENVGKQIVDDKQYRMLLTIAKRMRNNERCRQYMSGAVSEVSIVWIDDETGLACKARIDALSKLIVDLKTTQDVVKFPSSIANYGYHRQGAHYRDGWATLTGDVLPFAIIAVETRQPHAVNAAPVSEDALELGALEVRKTLRAIADATEHDVWPGPKEPERWCLPSWYGSGDPVELSIGGESVTI